MVNHVVQAHEAATLAEQAYAQQDHAKAIEHHTMAAESYKAAMERTEDAAVRLGDHGTHSKSDAAAQSIARSQLERAHPSRFRRRRRRPRARAPRWMCARGGGWDRRAVSGKRQTFAREPQG